MKCILVILGLSVVALCGCTTTRTASVPGPELCLMEDGKLLYEVGRFDEARDRLELLLAQTSDDHLRTNALYYLDLIHRDVAPARNDPGYPKCFVP